MDRRTPLNMRAPPLCMGLDVGTGSARAGIFDATGRLLQVATRPIEVYRVEGHPLLYQQSSEGIWRALCAAVEEVLGGLASEGQEGQVAALSVTATCSMVVMREAGMRPVDVTPPGATVVLSRRGDVDVPNVIMWLDHRARAEAEMITATGHPMLKHVGGKVSPENEIPKLLWIKTHLPTVYNDPATRYYDLADYLSLRLVGTIPALLPDRDDDARSLCCVGAKWMYDTAGGQWDRSLLEAIGLGELTPAQLGPLVKRPGEPLGTLSSLEIPVGHQWGARLLCPPAVVAVGTVDAFAGVVGSIGARLSASTMTGGDDDDVPLANRLAVIMGTSTCHLCCSPEPQFVPGVWGPFKDALGNGLWVAEAGQSATGKLLDHLLETHPAWAELQAEAAAHGEHPQQHLHTRLQRLAAATHPPTPVPLLAKDIHILPHWAGSRSPDADPALTGAIVGLTFDTSVDALARLYLAAVQALALGTKHVVDALETGGHGPISHLMISGGLGVKNKLLLQAHADATQRAVVLPGGSDEAVLLGAAVVAAVAAGVYPTVDVGMREMTRAGAVVAPDADPAVRRLYKAKERALHALREVQLAARREMGAGEGKGN